MSSTSQQILCLSAILKPAEPVVILMMQQTENLNLHLKWPLYHSNVIGISKIWCKSRMLHNLLSLLFHNLTEGYNPPNLGKLKALNSDIRDLREPGFILK